MIALVLAISLTAPPAHRLSSSPYIFTATPAQATRLVKQAMQRKLGEITTIRVTCQGRYPGTHDGHHGFHELRCPFSADLAGVVKRGTAVYWIDSKRNTQDRIYWR